MIVILLCISSFFNNLGTWGSHLSRGPAFKPARSVVSSPLYTRGHFRKNKQTFTGCFFLPNQNAESFIESHDPEVDGAGIKKCLFLQITLLSRIILVRKWALLFSQWKLNIQALTDSFRTFHSEVRPLDASVILVTTQTNSVTHRPGFSLSQYHSCPAQCPPHGRGLVNACLEAVCITVKNTESRETASLCHLLAVWFWASCLALGLSPSLESGD